MNSLRQKIYFIGLIAVIVLGFVWWINSAQRKQANSGGTSGSTVNQGKNLGKVDTQKLDNDPLERYVVLMQGRPTEKNYSLVFQQTEGKENVFILPWQEIYAQESNINGGPSLLGWTKDGRYFWVRFSSAAQTDGFMRIDTSDWSKQLFEAPQGLGNGEALNVENGWITHHPDMVWIGEYDPDDIAKEQLRQQGLGTKFYLYNLLTGKQILVYETSEPLFFTEPKWVSDTQIEYKVDSGERKIYQL